MRHEAIALLSAIRAYNAAHEGDSDDAEVDAAFEMEEAAITLLKRLAIAEPAVAQALARFEAETSAKDSA